MRTSIRAARDHTAQSRILAAAKLLAGRFGLNLGERGIFQRLQVQRGDVATRAMQEREAIADMLEELVAATEPAAEVWPDLKEDVIEALVVAGYTPESLRTAVVDDLVKVEGIGKRLAVKILKLAAAQTPES